MVNKGLIGKLPGEGKLPGGQRGQKIAQGGIAHFPNIFSPPLISDVMKWVLQSCQFKTNCLTSAQLSRRMYVIYSSKLFLLN